MTKRDRNKVQTAQRNFISVPGYSGLNEMRNGDTGEEMRFITNAELPFKTTAIRILFHRQTNR
jgi:hypothetical protein